MYICLDCGEVFEKPKIIEEHHPYGMTYAVEEWAVCPHCGDAGIEKAKRCSCCGEYFAELEDGLCEECNKEV
jgi:RecJ-like exonuclease